MGRFRAWIDRNLRRKDSPDLEGEVREEFRFHVEMKTSALVRRGMDPDAARALAEECFGDTHAFLRAGVRNLSSARRSERRRRSLNGLGQDFRDGAKRLARHPGYALLAAGTLALGLSTGTAVFTYVNAYERPFPGAAAKGAYQLFQSGEAVAYGPISYPDYLDLIGAAGDRFRVAASGQPLFAASVRHESFTEVVFGQGVTGDFFPLLRVEMEVGRGLSPEDDRAGAPPVVVISHEYWQRRYGAAADALGGTLYLNNRPHTIVGVAGPSFLGSRSSFRPQVWMPFEHFKAVYWARSDTEANRETGAVAPYLRPGPGWNEGAVERFLDAFASNLDQEVPLADRSRRFFLEPATWIHPRVREAELPTTRIMVAAAAALLLLACANMANLVLSAGVRRGREMALRAAMGASRSRLVRQLLAENLLLSVLAGGLGLAVAGPAANRITSYFASPSVWGANVPRVITVDPRVMGFAVLVAVVTGVVTGLVPALKTSGQDLAPTLKSAGRGQSESIVGGRPRFFRTRDLLVSVQVALAVVLLFVASLVLRTLRSAGEVDPGFNTGETLASYVSTSSMGTPVAEREAFFRELVERFEEMPWVRAATVAEQAPLSAHPVTDLRVDGLDEPIRTTVARVVPGYFEAMEVSLLRGRSFLPTDTSDGRGVAIVNETLARRFSEDGEALGSTLWLSGDPGSPERGFEVVGVVRNARQTSLLEDPEPVVYFSFPQHYYPPGNAFLLKVVGNPFAAVPRMEEELRRVDPRIAIVNVLPYSEVVDGFLYTQRMNAELFTVIAALGLVLSVAGVFGVVSLAVAQRRKEIGIRLAIGAGDPEIVRVAVARVLGAIALGVVVGLVGALLATRLVASLVWGVSPSDPASLASGVLVLVVAVGLAMGLPVQRALRIDPVSSLRVE